MSDEAGPGARATTRRELGSPVRPVTSLMIRAPASRAARAGPRGSCRPRSGTSSLRGEEPHRPGEPIGLLRLGDARRRGRARWTSRPRRARPRPPATMRLRRAQQLVGVGHDGARVERLRAHVERPHDGHVQAIAHRHPCQSRSGESRVPNRVSERRDLRHGSAVSSTAGRRPRGMPARSGPCRSVLRRGRRSRERRHAEQARDLLAVERLALEQGAGQGVELLEVRLDHAGARATRSPITIRLISESMRIAVSSL